MTCIVCQDAWGRHYPLTPCPVTTVLCRSMPCTQQVAADHGVQVNSDKTIVPIKHACSRMAKSFGDACLAPEQFSSLKACCAQGKTKQQYCCAGQPLGPSAGRGTGQGRMQAPGRGSGQVHGQAPASSSHMVSSSGPAPIPGHGLESLGSLPSLSPLGPGNLLNPPSGLGNLFNAEASSTISAAKPFKALHLVQCSKLPIFTAVATQERQLTQDKHDSCHQSPLMSSQSNSHTVGWVDFTYTAMLHAVLQP